MSRLSSENEGIQVLEDFVYQAEIVSSCCPIQTAGQGTNPGVHILTEIRLEDDRSHRSSQREALRAKITSDLLEYVKHHGDTLPAMELDLIHELAIERVTGSSEQVEIEAAKSLTQAVFQVALRKSPE